MLDLITLCKAIENKLKPVHRLEVVDKEPIKFEKMEDTPLPATYEMHNNTYYEIFFNAVCIFLSIILSFLF